MYSLSLPIADRTPIDNELGGEINELVKILVAYFFIIKLRTESHRLQTDFRFSRQRLAGC